MAGRANKAPAVAGETPATLSPQLPNKADVTHKHKRPFKFYKLLKK
jgi:hypothetical protein